jgi:hypothetical protein
MPIEAGLPRNEADQESRGSPVPAGFADIAAAIGSRIVDI